MATFNQELTYVAHQDNCDNVRTKYKYVLLYTNSADLLRKNRYWDRT